MPANAMERDVMNRKIISVSKKHESPFLYSFISILISTMRLNVLLKMAKSLLSPYTEKLLSFL